MSLRIVLSGAGSGGHITPLLAVAAELKRLDPSIYLIYIGQTGDGLGDIPAQDPNIDEVRTVRAGKFRRYHGEGLKQLLDVKTGALNIRDAGYVVAGLWQSRKLLKQLQPDLVFIKGGFVGVPVGLAAAQLNIPFVTHDSDAIPGLANRIIARWAAVHAVALPTDIYDYPADKTVTTGIPLQVDFTEVTPVLRSSYRQQLDVPATAQVLFIIGGGLGAQAINEAATEIVPHLLEQHPKLHVFHAVGRLHDSVINTAYDAAVSQAARNRIHVLSYVSDVYRYSGAADVIVTRAGATNLAEFAVQAKACIVVPHPNLTGGHQLKNARYLEGEGAIEVVAQNTITNNPNQLARLINDLLADPKRRQQLGSTFQNFANQHATHDLAKLLLKTAKTKQTAHETPKI